MLTVEGVAEPGADVGPFLAKEVVRDAEGDRDLFVPRADELAELDRSPR